jgi:hypothetical protein
MQHCQLQPIYSLWISGEPVVGTVNEDQGPATDATMSLV